MILGILPMANFFVEFRVVWGANYLLWLDGIAALVSREVLLTILGWGGCLGGKQGISSADLFLASDWASMLTADC